MTDCLLKFPQMSTSILNATQSNKQSQNIICALENSEDPEVSHNLLQAKSPHETISSQNLDCLVGDKPSSFRSKNLRNSCFEVVIFVTTVHSSCNHISHGLSCVVDHAHLGYLLLDCSVPINTRAKLNSLCSVITSLLNDRSHCTGQCSSHSKPSVV